MSQEKTKSYTAEFRVSAVKLANESDKPSPRQPGILESMSIRCIPGSVDTAAPNRQTKQCEPMIIFSV